jgi:hypothetical protein
MTLNSLKHQVRSNHVKNIFITSEIIQCVPFKKANPLMLFREIIVHSKIHTKHINMFCGYKAESSNVKADDTYSYSCTLNVYAFLRVKFA